jgi:hypothetical protein
MTNPRFPDLRFNRTIQHLRNLDWKMGSSDIACRDAPQRMDI